MPDATYTEIIYEVDDPVATITLNRPQALNAWTPTMATEVQHAVHRAERDKAVVGIIITGAGRAFCAGADLKVLTQITEGDVEQANPANSRAELAVEAGDPSWGDDLRGTYTYLMSVPKPIVAVINGAVAGMAVPIALSCDLRFMADDAVFTLAFSQRGLVAEWGSSWLLGRLVGSAAALDLLFSSRKLDGRECERLGLANRAMPAGELLGAAREYIVNLAATCSPASMAVMKRQVYQQLHAGLGAAEKESIHLMLDSFNRPDFAEGVQSFLQRRPPTFARIGDET